ncbi:hypothetical protein EC844_11025 [Acinetobacter calcoaceticus]|uniref:Lipoprotein n=1 Tax=Acinetobacter calcoaceticus TaxID=471 RepID=A0A4R1XRN0_ACICA|nr:hypothetical protein EC844_11025 [Acinetobacter calcoaceticus]
MSQIFNLALTASLLFLSACSSNGEQNTVNQSKEELLQVGTEERKYERPALNYSKSVSKVDLYDDEAIIKAVGKPVIEKEEKFDKDGELRRIYMYKKNMTMV